MTLALGAIPDPTDRRDYRYASAKMAQQVASLLPYRVDNRDECTQVMNQGEEPSCVACGVCHDGEFKTWRVTGQRPRFTPRWTYSKIAFPEGGSTARKGMQSWSKDGLLPWDYWPYEQFYYGGKQEGAEAEARKWKLWLYERIVGANEIRHAIHKWGSVIATLQITSAWENPHGEFIEPSADYIGFHLVELVGYDDGIGPLIKNSWGEGWGQKGYAWLPWRDFNENVTDIWLGMLHMGPTKSLVGWFRKLIASVR